MNFKVYTKENCPYCYKVKQVLELTGTQFVSYNLEEDFGRKTAEYWWNISPYNKERFKK